MGYTHYWRKGESPIQGWLALIKDVKHILNNPPVPIDNNYSVNKEVIQFNGKPDSDYEDFVLGAESTGFDFCKTGQRPYDIIVCATLILAKHHLGKTITVSSDGSPSEWKDALAYTRKTFGYGDFPFSEADIIDGFVSPYNEKYVNDYRKIRQELEIIS